MKIDRKDFESALKRTIKVIQTKHTMPILTHVLIDPDKGLMTGTDLEIHSLEKIRIIKAGNKPKPFCVNAKKLSEVVHALPDEIEAVEITLHKKDDIETISVHGTTLMTLPAEDYPLLPEFDYTREIKVDGLLEKMRRVVSAVGEDTGQHVLMAVHVDLERGEMAATNGHRLHVTHFKGQKKGDVFLISANAVDIVLALKGEVQLFRQKRKDNATLSVFKHENGVVISREVDGAFPNYRQVIPKELPIKVMISKEDLKEKIVQGWPVSLNGYKQNTGVFDFQEKTVVLSIFNREVGEYISKEIECEVIGEIPKKGLKVSFNLKYLLEALPALEGEKVFINLKDADSPMKMTGVDAESETIAVVMPMRI